MKLESIRTTIAWTVCSLLIGAGCAGDTGTVGADQQGLRGATHGSDGDRDKDSDEVADEAARGDAGWFARGDRDRDVDEAADEAAEADGGSEDCHFGARGFGDHGGFGAGAGTSGGFGGRR